MNPKAPWLLSILLCALSLAPDLLAAPLPVGRSLSGVVLSDLRDRDVPLSRFAGKVVIVLHEDKDTGDKNQGFKDALGELWQRHQGDLVIIALAEVSRFDFWPARRYVKQALAKVQDPAVSVLIDWKGRMLPHYPLPKAGSNILVLSRDGKVALARGGVLSQAEAAELLKGTQALLQRGGAR